jgi:quercetin dioxygenase-like cupin family protein
MNLRHMTGPLLFAVMLGAALASDTGPAPVLPDQLRWTSPPGNSEVHGAWVVGAERETGNYLLRVRIDAGGSLPPHTHPDTRNTTVLSGTLYVGFGATFDKSSVVPVPAGAVYVAPAGVAHYVWAKDGEVLYQEAGYGPTATRFIGAGP